MSHLSNHGTAISKLLHKFLGTNSLAYISVYVDGDKSMLFTAFCLSPQTPLKNAVKFNRDG